MVTYVMYPHYNGGKEEIAKDDDEIGNKYIENYNEQF
jgi:hypothetical protein